MHATLQPNFKTSTKRILEVDKHEIRHFLPLLFLQQLYELYAAVFKRNSDNIYAQIDSKELFLLSTSIQNIAGL